MNGTLNDALESAVTDGLKTEEDLGVSEETESSADETTDESKATEEDSTKESQDDDKSADESDKSKESKESKDTKDDEETEETTEDESEDDDKETFTKVDPNELPDEVKPVYKSLLGDYTRKRQEEAKVVKDALAENEELKRQIADGGNKHPQGDVKIDLTPEQIKAMSLSEYTNHVISKAQQVSQTTQESRDVKSYETEAVTGFLSMDARLNPELESTYDSRFAAGIGGKVDADYEAHIAKSGSAIGFDYKGSAEKHIKEWDEWVSGIKKESVKSTAKASKQKANKLKKSAPPTSNSVKSKANGKMDLGGAIGAAFDELAE